MLMIFFLNSRNAIAGDDWVNAILDLHNQDNFNHHLYV